MQKPWKAKHHFTMPSNLVGILWMANGPILFSYLLLLLATYLFAYKWIVAQRWPVLSCLISGQFEFAELLINNGANINVADENHNIPLHYAVNAGKLNQSS